MTKGYDKSYSYAQHHVYTCVIVNTYFNDLVCCVTLFVFDWFDLCRIYLLGVFLHDQFLIDSGPCMLKVCIVHKDLNISVYKRIRISNIQNRTFFRILKISTNISKSSSFRKIIAIEKCKKSDC